MVHPLMTRGQDCRRGLSRAQHWTVPVALVFFPAYPPVSLSAGHFLHYSDSSCWDIHSTRRKTSHRFFSLSLFYSFLPGFLLTHRSFTDDPAENLVASGALRGQEDCRERAALGSRYPQITLREIFPGAGGGYQQELGIWGVVTLTQGFSH